VARDANTRKVLLIERNSKAGNKVVEDPLDDDGLTAKEAKVLDCYARRGFKGRKRALREAGYVCPVGFDTLFFSAPVIVAVVERLQREKAKRRELSSQWVAEELAKICRFKISDLYHDDGTLKEPHELDEDTASAIQSVSYSRPLFDKDGNELWSGGLNEYKAVGKADALRLAMQHLNMLNSGGPQQKDRLDEVIEAMRQGPVKTAEKKDE
jgi:phage terminase small subunit